MCQAEKIIQKFGGADALSLALANIGKAKNRTTIYRWTYERTRGGTGGIIPNHVLPIIKEAARVEGILLTDEDLSLQSLDARGKQ